MHLLVRHEYEHTRSASPIDELGSAFDYTNDNILLDNRVEPRQRRRHSVRFEHVAQWGRHWQRIRSGLHTMIHLVDLLISDLEFTGTGGAWSEAHQWFAKNSLSTAHPWGAAPISRPGCWGYPEYELFAHDR